MGMLKERTKGGFATRENILKVVLPLEVVLPLGRIKQKWFCHYEKQTKKGFRINTLNFGFEISYSNLTCKGRTIAGGSLVEQTKS